MSNKTLFVVVIIIVLIFGGFFLYRVRNSNENNLKSTLTQTEQNKQSQTSAEEQNQTGQNTNQANQSQPTDCQRNFDENKFKTAKVDIKNRQVEITVKDFGKVKLALDDNAAPKTVENFLKLVNSGFYDCLTFHRIAKDFVIQGGDPQGDGSGGPGYTVPAEIKLLHKKGSIAMARLSDQVNPQKESSGSQFYIALNDLPQLDGQYTVFGQVVEGMDVVEKIGQVPIDSPTGDGAPIEKVVMEKVTIIK